jgi:hypothetical protein
MEDFYDDLLDECYPVVVIGGMHFFPSIILKKCDPIAYQQGLLDFEDMMKENAEMENA